METAHSVMRTNRTRFLKGVKGLWLGFGVETMQKIPLNMQTTRLLMTLRSSKLLV